eukprot:15163222-Ditylum_brightwellii.AAC.1
MRLTQYSGKCCSGSLCTHPHLQLCKEHTCPGCKGVVYVVCGSFDETLDKFWHKPHISECTTKNEKAKSEKVCTSCGGTEHLRKSSLKSSHNVKNQSPPKEKNKKVVDKEEGGVKEGSGKKNEVIQGLGVA